MLPSRTMIVVIVAGLALLAGLGVAEWIAGDTSDERALVAPFDVKLRRTALAGPEIPFTACPAIPEPVLALPRFESFYTDSAQSMRDEAKWQAKMAGIAKLRRYGQLLEQLTDDQIADPTPDPVRAACITAFLEKWAREGALLGHADPSTSVDRAWFVGLSAATALLVLQQDKAIEPSRAKPIAEWLDALAWDVIRINDASYDYSKRTGRYPNNHVYWAATAAMAAAVVNQDHALFDRATFDIHDGLEQVSSQGLLKTEIWRAGRAHAYMVFAANPLALGVRYADVNGGQLAEVNDGAIFRLADALIAARTDPDSFEAVTGARSQTLRTGWPANCMNVQFAELLDPIAPDGRFGEWVAPWRPVCGRQIGASASLLYSRPMPLRQMRGKPLPLPQG